MIQALKKSFLFKDVAASKILDMLESISYDIVSYEKGDVAYSETFFKKKIAIILDGNAKVEKNHHLGQRVFLNDLHTGDVFGILAVFSNDELYPTRIIFNKASRVLFLNEDIFLFLLKKDDQLLKNYLYLVNHHVQFLLNKIELFTTESVEMKLLSFLKKESEAQKATSFMLKMSKTELADFLGISRSSLYRIMDQLRQKGLISYYGKKICLLKGDS